MDLDTFKENVEHLSEHADLIQKLEPALSREAALRLALQIEQGQNRDDLLIDLKDDLLTELEPYLKEISKAIWNLSP